MHPIAIRIGSLVFYWYGVTLAISFLVGTALAIFFASKEGIAASYIIALILCILVGSIVGARVTHVLESVPGFSLGGLKDLLALGRGGLSFHGGLLGGTLAGWLYTRLFKLSFWKLFDIVTPSVALGLAITRVGCFLNGCCYGLPTGMPWGVVFPPGSPAGNFSRLPLHPTQLYASFGGLVLFAVLLALRRQERFEGFISLSFLLLYSIMRFVLEIYRASPRVLLFLSRAQIVSILVGLGALGMMMVRSAQTLR